MPDATPKTNRPSIASARAVARAGQRERRHATDYLRMLYRRRWTAAAIFVVVAGTVILDTLTAVPVFEAKVQLLIDLDNATPAAFKDTTAQDRANAEYYQTQYKILQSRTLARRTLDNLKLWTDRDFTDETQAPVYNPQRLAAEAGSGARRLLGAALGGASPVAPSTRAQAGETPARARVIDLFLTRLSVTPVRNSRLVDVTFSSVNPQLAARVANGLADQFIAQSLEIKYSASQDASQWLKDQLAEQRKHVEDTEAALQHYRERNNALSLDERDNIVVQKLSDLNAAVTRAKTERITKESLFRQLDQIKDDPAALAASPAILTNSFVQQLKAQLSDLQSTEAQLAEKFGDKHPEMIKVHSAIDSVREKLGVEVAKIVEAARRDYMAAQAQEQSLTEALDAQKSEAAGLNRKGIEYGVLQREAQSNRQVYEALLQRTKETGITGEFRASPIRVIDAAEAPRLPVSPDRTSRALLGAFWGLILAVGAVFGVDYMLDRITEPEQISQLKVPVLGMVPLLDHRKAVPPTFVESLRSFRANVLFSCAEQQVRTIIVTSTGPGEGKTVVAANLALSLADYDRRVLLIDGDMRRPRIHAVFNRDVEPGLSNVIRGDCRPSAAIRRTEIERLCVLPAGKTPTDPAQILGSERLNLLIQHLQQYFHWIIVDCPPVMAVVDAVMLANRSYGTVFVIGSEMTNRRAARSAIEKLRAVDGKIVGAVLNQVDLRHNRYYYSKYYGKHYGNYHASTLSAQPLGVTVKAADGSNWRL